MEKVNIIAGSICNNCAKYNKENGMCKSRNVKPNKVIFCNSHKEQKIDGEK